MKLTLCALVAALAVPILALPTTAQTRAKAEVQAELGVLSKRKQELESNLRTINNTITQYRLQRTVRDSETNTTYHESLLKADRTPETNPAIIELANRSGRDVYDEAIDQAQNMKSQVERELSLVKQQIEKDKAELKTAG